MSQEIRNVVVESNKRTSGTENNFTYNFLWPVARPDTVALESIQLFNTQYTINAKCNKFYMTDRGGTQRVITLTNGNYTATSLASHVENAINAVTTDVYSVSFSANTGKITITNPSGNFSLTFGTNTTNSCAYVLGFDNTNLTGASTYTGQNLVRLSTKYYLVYADIVSNNTYFANAVDSVIAYVPNDVVFGDLINYSPTLAKTFKVSVSDISTAKFYVKDDRDQIVDLNGVDWSMNLVVTTR